MNSLATVLFLASAALAAPQYYYQPGSQYYYQPGYGYGHGYGYGNYQSQQAYRPQSLNTFRYAQNPLRSAALQPQQTYNPLTHKVVPLNPLRSSAALQSPTVRGSALASLSSQNAMTPQQRAQYLPVMKALLKVMETKYPAAQDINTLMILTRDLSKQVPKGQNLLADFGNFGLGSMESMGLPESGDIIVNVDGTPHIRTQWGSFPLSDTTLMTDEERARFLPSVRAFTSVLQKDNVDPEEMKFLLAEGKKLQALLPQNVMGSIDTAVSSVPY